jgi:hypothetical protein
MQALRAIMRKLLTGIWSSIQRDVPFDSSKRLGDIHLIRN